MSANQWAAAWMLFIAGSLQAADKPDLFTCPKQLNSAGYSERASAIDLFSGPPAELAQLKPDNAETTGRGPLYWTMGPSQYDYWYVCIYKDSKQEFKLTKVYQRCTNIHSGNRFDRLKCK
ncbi:MAG: STY0301 family protein [Iodobacter sp.]